MSTDTDREDLETLHCGDCHHVLLQCGCEEE